MDAMTLLTLLRCITVAEDILPGISIDCVERFYGALPASSRRHPQFLGVSRSRRSLVLFNYMSLTKLTETGFCRCCRCTDLLCQSGPPRQPPSFDKGGFIRAV
uniref:Secreted protein n=1 Tax=Ascaris lumbricoides TaxID=6252 RepID=A0A0M3IFP8_ASCLU